MSLQTDAPCDRPQRHPPLQTTDPFDEGEPALGDDRPCGEDLQGGREPGPDLKDIVARSVLPGRADEDDLNRVQNRT